MKKIVCLLAIVVLIFSLVACSQEQYDKTEDRVKGDYVETFLKDEIPQATKDDVKIDKFYGTYDGCFVATIINRYYEYSLLVARDVVIADKKFSMSDGTSILAWKKGKFYELKEAYEKNYLTDQNISTIYSIFTKTTNDVGNGRFYGLYNGSNVYYEEGQIVVNKGEASYNLQNDEDAIIKEGVLTKKDVKTIYSIHENHKLEMALEEYKLSAKEQLINSAQDMDVNGYSEQSIFAANALVEKGQKAIQEAYTKNEVDKVLGTHIAQIDTVPTLESGIEDNIKQGYYESCLGANPDILVEDIQIDKYLGSYNGSYVVTFVGMSQTSSMEYSDSMTDIVLGWLVESQVKVWNNQTLYDIQQAYDLGLLTANDLFFIFELKSI